MTKKVPQDNSISWDTIARMGKYLTVRRDNWIALGMGIPVLIYAIVALSTSVLSGLGGYIGIAVFGVLY
ncbi:MAG: hypothetical protein JSV77_08065 [Dehalococcoidales bacterium]|nr:MAG: hypothetical protein JSV77_08065 [Dehalococcoidales bacterium]